MLQRYINSLITKKTDINIKPKPKSKPKQNVDLVFEGGLFNGSYQLGFLAYIKQMENLQLICVKRVSGCSIGAFMALLYFIDVPLDENIYFIRQQVNN